MANTDQTVAPVASHPGEHCSPHPCPARVLLVDDEPAACKLLSLILRPPEFLCMTAGNAEEAIVALQREAFDAVISDLCMPGVGGLALLAEARRGHPHTAFIVITGVDDTEVGVRAMRSGADDYLLKPLLGSAVLASLERALHKHQLEQQLENYRLNLEQMVAQRTAQVHSALQKVERSYEDTLQALGAAIDLRDNETAGHSQRVCLYSLAIARTMHWKDKELENLARGAYLHDIGKLGIPDGILLKPGPLTPEERKLMQQHVRIGFQIVKDIPFLADAAQIILSHHERYDGSGYPMGLKADEILPAARIFAVADTLDAITSDRPYQRASSFESARETIHCLAGRHFDPAVAAVFLCIPEGTWEAIARNQRKFAALSSAFDFTKQFSPSI